MNTFGGELLMHLDAAAVSQFAQAEMALFHTEQC